MSHRALDDIVDLRRRLATVEVEIMTARSAEIVDLVMLRAMLRRREEIVAHLARYEEAISQ